VFGLVQPVADQGVVAGGAPDSLMNFPEAMAVKHERKYRSLTLSVERYFVCPRNGEKHWSHTGEHPSWSRKREGSIFETKAASWPQKSSDLFHRP
jgi:hypothetical protein